MDANYSVVKLESKEEAEGNGDSTINDDENLSDVEILDSSQLRASYFRQQVRLMCDLQESGMRIPRDWDKFRLFVTRVLQWSPSEELMFSVYTKLCVSEHSLNFSGQSEVINLSDDEQTVERPSQHETPPGRHSNCKPSINVVPVVNNVSRKRKIIDNFSQKSQESLNGWQIPVDVINLVKSENVSEHVPVVKLSKKDPQVDINEGSSGIEVKQEINPIAENLEMNVSKVISYTTPLPSSDEADTSNPGSSGKSNKKTKKSTKESQTTSVSKRKKQPSKRKRKSSPMTEQEADALRERLFIDKLIELELPGVIRSVFGTLPNVNPITKRKKSSRRKSSMSVKK